MSQLLDGFWKYAISDARSPLLQVPVKVTTSPEFTQLAKLKLIRPTTKLHIVCPSCFQHSEDVEAVDFPDGSKKFFVFCPHAGTEEVTADDMRQWHIHFSKLPAILSRHLGLREPHPVVPDTLWKLGSYGTCGDIWFGRWLDWRPDADEWLRPMPRTPQTILLYIGQPPDLRLFYGMPQTNIIDVSRLVSVNESGLHVDMGPVDAALIHGAEPILADARVFRKTGDQWLLSFEGKTVPHRHLKGMIYIHYLLEIAPRQEPTVQLRRVADPDFQPQLLGNDGEILDELALYDFENRLSDIKEELQEALDNNDIGRQSKLIEEQLAIENERDTGNGLNGRKRRANDDLERNRKAVCNAIDNAIKSITVVHTPLGEHLDVHISRGDHCSYRLEPGKPWST
jgi:hypothetical protein